MKALSQKQSQMDGGFDGEDWYCPNCSSAWGLEEFESQSCYCCGYPEIEEETDEYEDFNEEIEGYEL